MRMFRGTEFVRQSHRGGRFVIVVHDVCPAHFREIHEVVAALEPVVGRTMAAAVVPNWHGVRLDARSCFAEWVRSHFGEVLLHGWTHEREAGRGIVSYCTNGSDEFVGLTAQETSARLQLGKNQLTEVFGHEVVGFVAPAWQRGRIDRKTLCQHGLEFLFGYLSIEHVDGRRIPVSTVTWDVGRFAQLGRAAESLGHALGWGRRRSMRCVAAHPVDVSRGYLPRMVSTVESWMKSGAVPILPRELVRLANGGPA
jgi:predicted deacetylase